MALWVALAHADAQLVLCRTTPHRRLRTAVVTHRSKCWRTKCWRTRCWRSRCRPEPGLLALHRPSSEACMAFKGMVSVQPPLAGLCNSIVADRGSQDHRDQNEKPGPRPCDDHTDQSRWSRDHLPARPHRRFRAAIIAHDRPCGFLKRSGLDHLRVRLEHSVTPVLRSRFAAEPGGQGRRERETNKTHPYICSIHIGHIILQSACTC